MGNVILQRKRGGNISLLARIMVSAAVWSGCLGSPCAFGNQAEGAYFQPGVRNSRTRSLSANQLRDLAEGIRIWTGFVGVHFDQQGRLRIVDGTRTTGGSEAARALIAAAVESSDAFLLENHNRSMAVAFASIQPVEDYVDAGEVRHAVWNLKLDFHDFAQLRGGSEALAAFDPAICLLHELGHGVLHLRDSVSPSDSLGDCEHYLNRIRREAGRAERQSYLPWYRLGSTLDQPVQSVLAQLLFVKRSAGNKAKTTLLSFRMESVCAPMVLRQQTGTN